MNGEELYEKITDIDDKHVMTAESYRRSKVKNIKVLTAVASLVLIVSIALYSILPLIGGMTSDSSLTEGAGEETVTEEAETEGATQFMSYSGPIFPLNSSNSDSVNATRNIEFDFIGNEYNNINTVQVNETYTLTNTSNEDKTVTLTYPFVSSFKDTPEKVPTITIDGESADISMNFHLNSGGVYGEEYDSFDDYKTELENVNNVPLTNELSENVTVYELTDYSVQNDSEYNPKISFSYDIDRENTRVLSFGFNGGSYDENYEEHGFSVLENNNESRYIIVIGEDIEDYNLEGTIQNEIAETECEVNIYTTTLEEALRTVIEDGTSQYEIDFSEYVSTDLVLSALSDLLFNSLNEEEAYMLNSLDDSLHYILGENNIMYADFQVTIPANSSVSAYINNTKEANFNYYGGSGGSDMFGYDLATKLGSNLNFTEQTASIVNYDNIEIVNQNFGFDLDTGVTEVSLDMSIEKYFMEIKEKE